MLANNDAGIGAGLRLDVVCSGSLVSVNDQSSKSSINFYLPKCGGSGSPHPLGGVPYLWCSEGYDGHMQPVFELSDAYDLPTRGIYDL